jgi:hypothetical protein
VYTLVFSISDFGCGFAALRSLFFLRLFGEGLFSPSLEGGFELLRLFIFSLASNSSIRFYRFRIKSTTTSALERIASLSCSRRVC